MTRLYNAYFNMMSNLKNKKGQGMVEYVLILALIAIAAITAMGFLGGQISDTFDAVKAKITPAP